MRGEREEGREERDGPVGGSLVVYLVKIKQACLGFVERSLCASFRQIGPQILWGFDGACTAKKRGGLCAHVWAKRLLVVAGTVWAWGNKAVIVWGRNMQMNLADFLWQRQREKEKKREG